MTLAEAETFAVFFLGLGGDRLFCRRRRELLMKKESIALMRIKNPGSAAALPGRKAFLPGGWAYSTTQMVAPTKLPMTPLETEPKSMPLRLLSPLRPNTTVP